MCISDGAQRRLRTSSRVACGCARNAAELARRARLAAIEQLEQRGGPMQEICQMR